MFRYALVLLLIVAVAACETEKTTENLPPQIEEQPSADQPAEQSVIDDVTDEELQKFSRVMLRAEEQRIGTRGELRALLEAEELDMWRFEEIEAASQRDPELRQRRAEMKRKLRDQE